MSDTVVCRACEGDANPDQHSYLCPVRLAEEHDDDIKEACAKIADDVASRFSRPDGEDEVEETARCVAREIAAKIRQS